ncbi:PAS domain-containing protein [Pseudomonas sp.]|uniref:PAS domain-containing protein n=1 Tax=Pseudomonas sp. TaxID=306 RepID=UPI003D0D2206
MISPSTAFGVFDWLRQVLRAAPGDLDQVPLALARLDVDGCIRQLNSGWYELTGHRLSHCLGQPLANFLHPADVQAWSQVLGQLRPARTEVLLLRYLTCSGERRWVEVRLRRRLGGFVASLGDITGQIQRRQSLQASHRSLSNLLDGLPMMVYRCRNNRHWSMEYVSAGCLELTGYRPEQLLDSRSLTFNDLIHPDDREHVWAEVQAGLQEQRAFVFDYRLLCADGQEKRVREHGNGIYAANGEVLGLEGVVLASA